ncbi:HEAT repeat domain-containing protein [Bacteroides clarus]|uniref:HEAT repeat domain-containing protein n=1 Tax=Bacteroides clarus TaxID=626929 RepID=UPI00241F6133|nr:HEAT repeat domain-containing protein [Bacteroides clarus]
MKKYILLAIATLCLHILQAQTVILPSIKTKTTFAIVVDQKSYDEVKSEIDAYRSSIENEGLGTYLLIDNWKRPESIREQLIKLHKNEKAPLEGCVFIGDIPIPMIRDAHHLSSAFKMSPKANWQKSSIPSDRYYDDFGLTFDYIKQDSLKPDYHYMTLRADSKQYISPDIYSARIRPLHLKDQNPYQMLRDYLKKTVAEKEKQNTLDQLTMARGHGYNSEDPLAWSGEQMALREQLPQIFKPGNTVKFYDFDMRYPMKPLYLNEIQREGLDIMLFHHHGGPTMQYINGYENGSSINLSIENAKIFLRSKVPSYAKKHGREAAIKEYAKQYGVPESWCAEAFDEEKIKSDSIVNRNMDIYTEDIRLMAPNARFVLFDACFNGSFHLDDNIVGSYIFNRGKTIVTMGCTVNTIQDKWPDEFLGLLATGMRIGQFTRFTCFLENHLIGDPTFHFINNSELDIDINQALVLQEGNVAFWKKQLNSPMADMQAMALRQLSMANYSGLVDLLKKSYYESNYFVVRLEALRLLTLNHPTEVADVLQTAMNDSYELIRRYAVEYVEKNSNPKLLPAWIESYLLRGHENRHRFRIFSGIDTFDHDTALNELQKQAAKWSFYDSSYMNELSEYLPRQKKGLERDFTLIGNPESTTKQIQSEISRFRNKPITKAIEALLNIVKNENLEEELRVSAAETLGWYNLHYDKATIIKKLNAFQTSNPKLMNEVTKTIHRLEGKNR